MITLTGIDLSAEYSYLWHLKAYIPNQKYKHGPN